MKAFAISFYSLKVLVAIAGIVVIGLTASQVGPLILVLSAGIGLLLGGSIADLIDVVKNW